MGYTIRFISTTKVRPTTTSQSEEFIPRIELTPWDLQLLLVDQIQKGLLFHKPESNYQIKVLNNKSLIEHLKSSFSAALDIFYPLAGRLAVTDNKDDHNTSSFFVDCNSATGADFVHAVADGVTVADILDPAMIPNDIVYSFFPMNGVLNYEGVSKPLLAVQVTELDDGIFIGCTMNHSVADGSSFWNFFNTWSEISRSGKISQPRPLFSREFLDRIIDLPIRIPNFQNQIPKKIVLNPLLQQRMFHFSKEKIAELKAKANSAEIGSTKISSLQALMAHLWVCITRNRHLSPDQETNYRLLVGIRQRIQPRLPNNYLGNAVLLGQVTSTAGELLEHGLVRAASEMNKMIASQTEQEVGKQLEEWMTSPKVLTKTDGLVRSTLITGSSPRFNVYGNDFGWARPVAVRSGPGNKIDGKLTVFAGAEEGSIDFEACLSSQTLQGLEEDKEFMASLAE